MGYEVKPLESGSEIICEAIGCSSKGVKRLAINVGSEGVIFLSLCDACTPKIKPNHRRLRHKVIEMEKNVAKLIQIKSHPVDNIQTTLDEWGFTEN